MKFSTGMLSPAMCAIVPLCAIDFFEAAVYKKTDS